MLQPSIESICAEANADHWDILAGRSAIASARQLRAELRETGAVWVASPSNGPAEIRRAWRPLLATLHFGIAHLSDLSLICYERRNHKPPLLWRDIQTQGNGTWVLNVLATNLVNTLLCFRTSLLSGFPTQARVLFRSFFELSELTLAILANKDLYLDYFQGADTKHQSYLHWRKYLTPGRIRRILKDRLDERGIPPDLVKDLDVWRQDVYMDLSTYSHASWMAQLFSAFLPSARKRGYAQWSLGGTVTSESVLPLIDSVYSIGFWTIQLTDLLAGQEHGWNGLVKDNDRTRSWFMYRAEIIKRYFLAATESASVVRNAASR